MKILHTVHLYYLFITLKLVLLTILVISRIQKWQTSQIP